MIIIVVKYLLRKGVNHFMKIDFKEYFSSEILSLTDLEKLVDNISLYEQVIMCSFIFLPNNHAVNIVAERDFPCRG